MMRLPLVQLERRCQKPDHRRIGNWLARRVSRPLALRVTWLILPWGVSANATTWAAVCVLAAACGVLTVPTAWAWLGAGALLHVWYLLDHVDGQLARYHGSASLDGVQLDYLMHHAAHLWLPLAAGGGLFRQTGSSWWLLAGVAWANGWLLLGLLNDTRYKAFFQRLKRVRGTLTVVGGGARTEMPKPPSPNAWDRCRWLARKLCELHVVLCLVPAVGAAQAIGIPLVAPYVALMAVLAPALACAALLRQNATGAAEAEFKQWFRVPPGATLSLCDGWWLVETEEPNMPKLPEPRRLS